MSIVITNISGVFCVWDNVGNFIHPLDIKTGRTYGSLAECKKYIKDHSSTKI